MVNKSILPCHIDSYSQYISEKLAAIFEAVLVK